MKFIVQNWGVIFIVLPILLGAGIWILISTGMAHRLMDWASPTSDKFIPSKVFCEDKQIRDRQLKIGRYVVSDVKKFRAFYLVHKLLLTGADGRGKFLALTERNARPIDFHGTMTKEDWAQCPTAQRVFIDTTADIRSESAKEASQNFMAQALSIMALAGAVVVVVFFVIVFYSVRAKGG